MARLTATNTGIFPVQLAAKPILGFEFVQLYDVPVPPKIICDEFAPLQSTRFCGTITVGVGFTVMVIDCVVPLHVKAAFEYCGVNVMLAATAVMPVFTAVNAAMFPVPLPANPMEGVLLVHVYDVPVPKKFKAFVVAELQSTWSGKPCTFGVGFTVIV